MGTLNEIQKTQLANRGYSQQDIISLDAGQPVSNVPQQSTQPNAPPNPFAPPNQQQAGAPAQQSQQPAKSQAQQPQQSQTPITPAPPTQTPTAPGQGMDPVGFTMLAKQLEVGLQQNSSLLAQRNLLVKHLYDSAGLTPQEMATLSPELQQVLNSGDKLQQEMWVRMLGDQVKGRFQSLDMSMNFLTQGYTAQQQYLNDKKSKDLTNVMNYIHAYGSSAPTVLEKLYGPQGIEALKTEGIDVSALSGVQTIAQERLTLMQGAKKEIEKLNKLASVPPKLVKGSGISWLGGTPDLYEYTDLSTGEKGTATSLNDAISLQNQSLLIAKASIQDQQASQSQSDWAIEASNQ